MYFYANHTRYTARFGPNGPTVTCGHLRDHMSSSTTGVHEHYKGQLLIGRTSRGRATVSATLGLATAPASMGQSCASLVLIHAPSRRLAAAHRDHSMAIFQASGAEFCSPSATVATRVLLVSESSAIKSLIDMAMWASI